jgi:hypothetical protein
VDELADQEVQAIVLANLEDRDDAGVAQLAGAPRFTEEPIEVLSRGEGASAGHLEGDDPIEVGIARLEHGAEGPRTDDTEQLEPAKPAPAGLGEAQGGLHAGLDRGATGRTDQRPTR